MNVSDVKMSVLRAAAEWSGRHRCRVDVRLDTAIGPVVTVNDSVEVRSASEWMFRVDLRGRLCGCIVTGVSL